MLISIFQGVYFLSCTAVAMTNAKSVKATTSFSSANPVPPAVPILPETPPPLVTIGTGDTLRAGNYRFRPLPNKYYFPLSVHMGAQTHYW